MKTCRIGVTKPILEDKNANQVDCGCRRKEKVPVTTDID